MVSDFWHTISIFQAQVRDLTKQIEAEPKKHNAYKKNVYQLFIKILFRKNILSEGFRVFQKNSFITKCVEQSIKKRL